MRRIQTDRSFGFPRESHEMETKVKKKRPRSPPVGHEQALGDLGNETFLLSITMAPAINFLNNVDWLALFVGRYSHSIES